jgi:hypothetical protein
MSSTAYNGTACNGTVMAFGAAPDNQPITYHVPGGVTHFSKYDEVHATNMTHGEPDLLAWHRELVRKFEDELRAFDPTVSVPYWDWEVGSAFLMDPQMPNFMGTPNNYDSATNTYLVGARAGNTSISVGDVWANLFYESCDPTCSDAQPPIDPCTNWAFCTQHGPPCRTDRMDYKVISGTTCLPNGSNCTSAWNASFPVQRITRFARLDAFNPPDDRTYSALMAILDFKDFATALHLDHTDIHNDYFNDSTVGPPMTAARDPFFFLIHSNFDRVWQSWQNNPLYPHRKDPSLDGSNKFLYGDVIYGCDLDTPYDMNCPGMEPVAGSCIMGGHLATLMEGIQTCFEPWSDIASTNNMMGYRHVRPYTQTCGEPNCVQLDPYTPPQGTLYSLTASVVVPSAMYDRLVQ